MKEKNSTAHSYNDLDLVLSPSPDVAKKVIGSKKRGRPGKKIAEAFKEIPSTPVDFVKYCSKHKLEPTVLRQIKRHDPVPETGRVYVRKNTDDKSDSYGEMQIWRDANKISPWLVKKSK